MQELLSELICRSRVKMGYGMLYLDGEWTEVTGGFKKDDMVSF